MKVINHKVEVFSLFAGASATVFFEDMVLKIITTAIAMVIGSTVAFFWRRYLINKYKDK